MAVGLLAEKVVGGRSRYAFIVYVTESYRTLYTVVPLCATNPGAQVSFDAGVSMQRGRLDAAVLRVEEEVCGKSGPVGEITVRTRPACCQLWSGCIDVVRPRENTLLANLCNVVQRFQKPPKSGRESRAPD